MSLLGRLMGTEKPKLSIHGFAAALREFSDGQVTKAQVVSAFELSVDEETDLDSLIAKYNAATNQPRFLVVLDDILILAEHNMLYTTVSAINTRLSGI